MMSKKNSVSVIIPVKEINAYINESIPKVLALNWPNLEIIVVVDNKIPKKILWPKTTIISSGAVGPSHKRDLASKIAKGEILAFLDDDAYPNPQWLKQALKHFQKSKVAAVGGPAITPANDNLLQKVSGAIFESYIGGAKARDRYLSIGSSKPVEDWPTVNLLIKKDVFLALGGFDTQYWPGEDTKLCLDLINKGYQIIYEPQAVVYHHRRSDLLKHFKQIGNYGLHRGFFAKKYPKTSLKFWYFLPSFFVLYCLLLVILLLSFSNKHIQLIAAGPLLIYFLGLMIDGSFIAIRWKNILVGLLTMPMILLTHWYYGIRFLLGLLITELKQ